MASARWLLVFPMVGFVAGVLLTGSALVASPPRAQGSSAPVAMFPVPEDSASPPADRAMTFGIDALQVSVADYDACVRAGACAMVSTASGPDDDDPGRYWQSALCHGGRLDRADEPMDCVDWTQAEAYCRWVGKRLPTVEEWIDGARALQVANGEAWSRAGLPHVDHTRPGMPPEEWTSTSEGPGLKGSQPTLRRVCGSRKIEAPSPLQWQSRCNWQSVVSRKPSISFRCVR